MDATFNDAIALLAGLTLLSALAAVVARHSARKQREVLRVRSNTAENDTRSNVQNADRPAYARSPGPGEAEQSQLATSASPRVLHPAGVLIVEREPEHVESEHAASLRAIDAKKLAVESVLGVRDDMKSEAAVGWVQVVPDELKPEVAAAVLPIVPDELRIEAVRAVLRVVPRKLSTDVAAAVLRALPDERVSQVAAATTQTMHLAANAASEDENEAVHVEMIGAPGDSRSGVSGPSTTKDVGTQIAVAVLQTKVDMLEKSLARFEDKLVTKWDVATVTFTIVSGLAGVVGAVLAVAKWITG